ncbi:hypothetical protein B0T22DRAFT_441849 [Podospora appendiculata]|uniref:Uncharacterized protein n=1 Tax=Podospora appendiculata TaxID=314037 RepID=A0AAE0XDG3_9PEZI|nr:hypothetical protein B0T22DRAFT_441849 [Podospora appendiculata]
MVEPYGVYGDPLFPYHRNGAAGIRQLEEKDGEQVIGGPPDRRFSGSGTHHHLAAKPAQQQHHQQQHTQSSSQPPQPQYYPPPAQPADSDLESIFGLSFLESDHNTAQMGIVQWNELVATRQLAQALQTQLRQAARDRDLARLQASTLRNELYAARQVEKRLRIERDEARGQVAFLKRERAEGRRTEFRLRRERNEARMVLVLARGDAPAASTKQRSEQGLNYLSYKTKRRSIWRDIKRGEPTGPEKILTPRHRTGTGLVALQISSSCGKTLSVLPVRLTESCRFLEAQACGADRQTERANARLCLAASNNEHAAMGSAPELSTDRPCLLGQGWLHSPSSCRIVAKKFQGFTQNKEEGLKVGNLG